MRSVTDSPAGGASDDAAVMRMANVLLRHRLLILRLALAGALLTAVLTLLQPRTWSARSSFKPQSTAAMPNLAGMAAQFGMSLGRDDPGESPNFYSELVRSRELQGQVAMTKYRATRNGTTSLVTLADVYGTRGRPEIRRDAAIKKLNARTEANAVTRTGIVNLTVRMPGADLAYQVNARFLELLNTFNMEKRRTRAAAERRFTEKRLAEVKTELRSAEDRLETFLKSNRIVAAPELLFQKDRLQREVDHQQDLLNSVAQAFEKARLDEIRDTPVLTTVTQPEVPVRPDSRGLVKRTLLGLLAGAAVGIVTAMWLSARRSARLVATSEYLEFDVLSREAIRELRNPVRLIGRTVGVKVKAISSNQADSSQ